MMTHDPIKKLLADAEAAAPALDKSDDEFVTAFINETEMAERMGLSPLSAFIIPSMKIIRLGQILRERGLGVAGKSTGQPGQ
jgi:hypothetical protein